MERIIKIGTKNYSIASDDNYLDEMGNVFEPHMVQLFRALIGPDDVVADIGANIGLTAILFSMLASKVIAFEPSPSTFNLLTQNLARAGINTVEAINLGLGSKIESLTITFAGNNRSGGFVSEKIKPTTGHVTEKIRIDTIDHFFANQKIAPTFLKIDVEGFEKNVIKGGKEFLLKNKPTVVMEMNHFCLGVLQRITIPDFLDFMRFNFPYLYAIDLDNTVIVDLHDADRAYFVMHEHVVRQRFPNLVGGFDNNIKTKLDELAADANKSALLKQFSTPVVVRPKGMVKAGLIPDTVSVGNLFEIEVQLTNNGEEDWIGYGSHPVLLCYHWQNTNGSYCVYDGIRSAIKSQLVRPGSMVEEIITIAAPNERGTFNLILTVVQEGVCWFEDKGLYPEKGLVEVF